MTVYGLVASFPDADHLLAAARTMRARGYNQLDAYSPYPIEEMPDVLRIPKSRLPLVMLAGAALGAALSYGLIIYSVEIDYPINVGGRPLHSWPAYIVLAFEFAILGAAVFGFFGMIVSNGLPEYYHPVFNAPHFTFAQGGVFCLLIKASDPKYRKSATEAQLRRLGSNHVSEVKA